MDAKKKKAWEMVHEAYSHRGVPIVTGYKKLLKEGEMKQRAVEEKITGDFEAELKKIQSKKKERQLVEDLEGIVDAEDALKAAKASKDESKIKAAEKALREMYARSKSRK